MVQQIRHLFADIYPDQPDILNRVCYDPKRQDHISTKVAYIDQEIIGQANIFYHKALKGNANLGFHVHPSKRKLGIATALSNEAIKVAHSKGISLFYIMTNKDNYPAIAVAKKLGFVPVGDNFTKNNITILKKQLLSERPTN